MASTVTAIIIVEVKNSGCLLCILRSIGQSNAVQSLTAVAGPYGGCLLLKEGGAG